MKKNLIDDTINKIKNQHIAMEPRWKYLARKNGMWLFFMLIVFLGAASLSAGFSQFSQLDWDLYRFTHQGAFGFILAILPYFWILLIGIFVGIAFVDVRNTEKGYLLSRWKITLMVVGSLLLISFFISSTGLASNMNTMMNKFPAMQNMMVTKQGQWSQPQNGFISGAVTSISANGILLKDFNGSEWNVSFNEQTLLRPAFTLTAGQQIKIIGTYSGDRNFAATEIRPWQGGGMMRGFDSSHVQNMQNMMNSVRTNGADNSNGNMMNRRSGGGMMGR